MVQKLIDRPPDEAPPAPTDSRSPVARLPADRSAPPPRDENVRGETLRHDRLPPAPFPPSAGGGALSRCDRQMPFEWTLNPYRGCEYACGYCYARATHWYLGFDDPADFERRIFFKEDLARSLARDLERRVSPGQRIAVGTATDPYQPLERRKEITRSCLRVFARRAAAGDRGLRLSITTKSDLVLRDLDLLRVIAAAGSLHVNLSLSTLDPRLARDLEPLAPAPQRRLMTLHALAAEGIEAGVFLMPVLPGLTDGPGEIEAVAEKVAANGGRYLVHQCLFLREPVRAYWLERLRTIRPALVARHEEWYRGRAQAGTDYRRALA
ncbi:MAG: radical SAM protein, partial [Planctomycetaceae bacterium]|nr:radical SAM protein [Planctomycetaceae bacterium]